MNRLTNFVVCSKNNPYPVCVLSYADGGVLDEGIQFLPYWGKCPCQKGVALISFYGSECEIPC